MEKRPLAEHACFWFQQAFYCVTHAASDSSSALPTLRAHTITPGSESLFFPRVREWPQRAHAVANAGPERGCLKRCGMPLAVCGCLVGSTLLTRFYCAMAAQCAGLARMHQDISFEKYFRVRNREGSHHSGQNRPTERRDRERPLLSRKVGNQGQLLLQRP